MSPEECHRLEALAQQQAGSHTFDMDYDNDNTDFGNILDGTHTIEISHAGENLQANKNAVWITRLAGITLSAMFRSFLEVHRTHWSHVDPNSSSWDVQVIDVYYALELYHVAWLRNPHFSIQAFVKSICDLHGTRVDSLINTAIHRNSPDWHLRNACPCCTYELQNEPTMTFRLLYATDGNDSLKRVSQRLIGADGNYLGPSIKLPTTQWEYVDMYASPAQSEEYSVEHSDEENPCAG
ncbi:hypothetical protein DFJ58DRAFT_839741 [Suillus subalutaceus]|uniref:uncharacterized protein n=1 Tax=Suillus subalutaceus TaxID=48586 RepID=UPI001B866CC8|nr:uncharacterized protein DFJ58DRAFT_839741 [Suillus subalutaceus]KAG1861097.1 hypothetical protein DFJ58DRAFT_839741 [Suillus subalutaceus]